MKAFRNWLTVLSRDPRVASPQRTGLRSLTAHGSERKDLKNRDLIAEANHTVMKRRQKPTR